MVHYKYTKCQACRKAKSTQLVHTLLSNVTMSLLSAISHENALPKIAQSSIRVPHIFLLTALNHESRHTDTIYCQRVLRCCMFLLLLVHVNYL